MRIQNTAAPCSHKLATLAVAVAAALTATIAPAQPVLYVGNNSSFVPNGNSDGSPPFVILGQYNPGGPPTTSAVTLPSGTVQDVQVFGGNYNFTLYALSLVRSGPHPNEQTFQVTASQSFSGSASTGTQLLSVTNFPVTAGQLLAFAGTGPYYPNGNSEDGTNTDATYEDVSNPGSFTATPPGGPGTQFVVGLNGDTNATYEYVPDFFQNQGRTYGIGVDVQLASSNSVLRFGNPMRGADQIFRAQLTGPATGSNYVIESSTNLPQWTTLVAVPSPAGSYSLADSNAPGLPRAFYRAYLTPANAGPPTIIVQPQDTTNNSGSSASFSVATGGGTPQTYEWTGNGGLLDGVTNAIGAESAILVITNVTDGSPTFFGVTVTNAAGMVISRQAQLTIIDPPQILNGPDDRTNNVGTTASFEVTASGTQPLTYKWSYQGQVVSGATQPELILPNITIAEAGTYSVTVSNSAGIASGNAVLDVPFLSQSLVTSNPYVTTTGSTIVLQTFGSSIGPIFYQWRLNGEVIPDATNATLVITNAQLSNGGVYYATIYNSLGAVDGDPISVLFTNLAFLPSDDTFTNRGSLGATISGSGQGNNIGATQESGEPFPGKNPGGSSVWLSWTAPSNGIATFTTTGSGFDTLLAVFTGNVLGTLAPINSDDDGGDFYTSQVIFNAKAGVTYDIDIDGFFGAQGNYVLSWNLEPTTDRVPRISVQPVSQTVAGGSDVNLFVVVTNTTFVNYQWRREGQDLPGATSTNFFIGSINADQVANYQVAITDTSDITPRTIVSDAASIQIGSQDAGVNTAVSAVDKFENAAYGVAGPVPGAHPLPLGGSLVGGYSGSQIFSSVSSKTQYKEPDHCGVACSGSVWFYFVPPCSGQLAVNDLSTAYNAVLAAYQCPPSGTCALSNLIQLACSQPTGPGLQSITFPVVSGSPYYICVATPLSESAPSTASINYTLTVPVATVNITGPGGLVTHGQTANFTSTLGNPPAGVTYTYRWQISASTNGNVVNWANISSGNSPAAYTGTASTFTIPSTPITDSNKQFHLYVTDSCGSLSVTSAPVTVKVK